MNLSELRQEVFECNLELVRQKLVVLTWGNVSGIDRERGLVAIKPSGVAYDSMRAEDIVVVDMDGRVVDGHLRPSSDLATHLALYRAFPDIGGVVHTHSPKAVAWAQAGRDIPALGTTHADHFFGPVPCTRVLTEEEVSGGYERNTGKVIVERFEAGGLDPSFFPGVLVAGHGPFTWGKTPRKAVENSVALEMVSAMALDTLVINPSAAGISSYVLAKHHLRKHGPKAYYGQGV